MDKRPIAFFLHDLLNVTCYWKTNKPNELQTRTLLWPQKNQDSDADSMR